MSKSKVAVKLDDQILTAVNWLRDAKRSGVATREAVQYERRVEFFKGAKMLDALVGDKYKALKSVPVLRSRDEAKVLCGQMMKQQVRVRWSTRRRRPRAAAALRARPLPAFGPLTRSGAVRARVRTAHCRVAWCAVRRADVPPFAEDLHLRPAMGARDAPQPRN
jgi:hypothetical protein